MNSNIGERIRRFRKTRGFSQTELANKIGIHRVSLARIESGTENPGEVTIQKIAEELGISVAKIKNKLPREKQEYRMFTLSELKKVYNLHLPIIIKILHGAENECDELFPGFISFKSMKKTGEVELVGMYKYGENNVLSFSDYKITWVAYQYDFEMIKNKYNLDDSDFWW